MAKNDKWTTGRTFLVIFLCFDLAIIAAWLVLYYDMYTKIAQVVGGIWGAVVAVLTFLGFKARKTRSLSHVLWLPPVRIIVIVYTVLIFALMPVFALWEFPLHPVEIDAQLAGVDKVQMSMINNDDKSVVYRNEQGIGLWEFRAKKGNYTLSVKPEDSRFEERTLPVNICLLCFENRISAIGLFPLGTLIVRPHPDGMAVLIDNRKIAESTPVTVNIPPGTHRITLIKPGEDERFGYYSRSTVSVIAGESTTIRPTVGQRTLPELIIIPTNTEGSFVYSLKSEMESKHLGPVGEPRRIHLFPGRYQLTKKPQGSQAGETIQVEIVEGTKEVRF